MDHATTLADRLGDAVAADRPAAFALHPSAHLDSFCRDNLPPADSWPHLLLDDPTYQYPARLNAAVELVDRQIAAGHGDRIAVASPHEQLTFRQLAEAVAQVAHVLVDDLGLVPGNRVLLRGYNSPRMLVAWLAVTRAGGVAVNTMPLLRAVELAKIIDRGCITLALCDQRLADALTPLLGQGHLARLMLFDGSGAAAAAELETRAARKPSTFAACATASDDVALMAFTSGTTGVPKATLHFHRDILAIADGYAAEALAPRPGEVYAGSPPLAFTFGLGGLAVFPLRFGATALLLEDARPPALLEAIARHRINVLFTAPTAYRLIAQEVAEGRGDVSSLRVAVSAGETLPQPICEAWLRATGVPILDGIGATEMLHIFITNRLDDLIPGATGRPVRGYQAMIVDDDMNPLPRGEVGRLAVRGPTGCRYLYGDRQETYVRGGWNLTGDAFWQDEAGLFRFAARADDMIVSAGYNIAAPEVEEALLTHRDVAECAVVGIPDNERGQIVKAYVVLRDGCEPGPARVKLLQDHVKAVIAPFKYPRAVEFVAALPRTLTGKVQRFRLREEALSRLGRGDEAPIHTLLHPSHWKKAIGYANGVLADGRQVYVGGQIGWDRDQVFQSDDLVEQIRQTLDNIVTVVAEAGGRPEHITRLTWYVLDKREYLARLREIGQAYRSVMGRHFPAMTMVQVVALVEDRAKVEIEATAVLPR